MAMSAAALALRECCAAAAMNAAAQALHKRSAAAVALQ